MLSMPAALIFGTAFSQQRDCSGYAIGDSFLAPSHGSYITNVTACVATSSPALCSGEMFETTRQERLTLTEKTYNCLTDRQAGTPATSQSLLLIEN